MAETRMRETRDYTLYYRGFGGYLSWCRIRIYQTDDERNPETYVLATEPEGDSGTSVTNMAKYLAATVMEENGLAKIVWIEHYESSSRGDHEYDLATFELEEPRWELSGGTWRRTLGAVNWKTLGREQIEALLGPLSPHRQHSAHDAEDTEAENAGSEQESP